jgi:hypothetical protein
MVDGCFELVGVEKLCKRFFVFMLIFLGMRLKKFANVFTKDVCFLDVASYPSSLRCPKLWRRFLDLFYFLGHLPQEIVSRFS